VKNLDVKIPGCAKVYTIKFAGGAIPETDESVRFGVKTNFLCEDKDFVALCQKVDKIAR